MPMPLGRHDLRVPEKNNSTFLLVFWPVYCVTSNDTYLDMRRWMCLVERTQIRRNLVELFLTVTLKAASDILFEDGTGLVLEPVGGEFQPSFATAHPGGSAHLVRLCQLSRLCQAWDVTQILFLC
jgi:hypothetical protein